MRLPSKKTLVAVAVLLLAASSMAVSCYPSGGDWPVTMEDFTYKGGDDNTRGYYDSWGYNRNNYDPNYNGFFPNLVYETIGENEELAWSIGEDFKDSYSSDTSRAVAILQYVQRWTEYGYDEDNVFVDGEAQEEWAWNADETAHMFDTSTGEVAIGDCEDMAFLCGTIYLGAGYDVAMVDAPGHAALLIWLPEYANANYYWDLGDGRGEGWIWVESTGEMNPLGWTPTDYNDGDWTAYIMSSSALTVNFSPREPTSDDDVTVTVSVPTGSIEVSRVQLKYSVNGGTVKTLTMTGSGSTYRGTIPNQSDGATVEFQVFVTDVYGEVIDSGIYSYTVGEEIEIPGFPLESIITGLIIGILILYQLSKKRSSLPIPST
jgi:hypothetical protein